jgi:hypothetical protein
VAVPGKYSVHRELEAWQGPRVPRKHRRHWFEL